jgi:hypothetical protein
MAEIQKAIEKLPQLEKEALLTWLSSHEGISISVSEEASLLASLDKAENQLGSGQGMPLDKARNMVRKWASK